MTSHKRENPAGAAVRGEGGVPGERDLVGFHFWGKCTVPLSNIQSDWTSKLLLACVLTYLFI